MTALPAGSPTAQPGARVTGSATFHRSARAALVALGLAVVAVALLRPYDAAVADWARHQRALAALPLALLDHLLRFGLLALVMRRRRRAAIASASSPAR